jgi:hypothetical protein
MGTNYNPRIVTANLALALDAASVKSYPGTGNTWFDVSGNGRDFSMLGAEALTWQANNNGLMQFNSALEYTRSAAVQSISTSAITIALWVRVNTHANWNNFINNNWPNNGWIMFASTTNWFYGIGVGGVQTGINSAHGGSNAWTNLVGTYDGTTINFYVNGVLVGTNTGTTTLDVGQFIYVGGNGDPGAYDIATTHLYNRTLSAAEIKQNFEALRGRFGV